MPESYLGKLRRAAEQKINKGEIDELNSTLHELKVHQIELEMQNQELRETQLQLQKALGDYKALYHQSPVGYVTLDKSGRIHEANQTFCQMLDRPIDHLRRAHFAELIADEYQSIFRQRFAPFYKQPVGKVIEVALDTAGTEPFYVALQGQHLARENESEEPTLAVNVINVTAQRNIENSLFLAETVIDLIPDGIFICQINGQVLKLNKALSTMTGFSDQQLRGKNISLLSLNSSAEQELRHLLTALPRTGNWRGDLQIRHEDSSELLCELNLQAIYRRTDEPEPLCCIGVLRDVTLQRKIEKKLQQSQKMDSLGTLVGGLAHNFNNLLSGLIGNLFLLGRDRTLGQKAHNRIEAMTEICDQASGILKNLLAFTRSEAQEQEVLDLGELISVVISLHRPVILENIQIDFDTPRKPMLVKGDKNQLMQMLLNLLVNAIDALKHTEKPKISITLVKTERQFSSAPVPVSAISLSFRDNGSGIDRENLDKIFDPFFSTKEVGKGTGLGLSTVFGIVKGMQGSIEVTSQPGDGTTFHIYIPSAAEQELVKIDQVNMPVLPGGKERILLVEDNQELREALCEILSSLDYQVTEADSGHRAMEIFLAHKGYFDLLVTDEIMPETSGLELIRSLRKQGYELPAVIITGNYELVFDETEELNYRLLRKPFQINVLSQLLADTLTTKQ